MSSVRKCADCGRFCNRLYDVPCNPSCNGIDREVCERCAPHAGAAVENNQSQPQHEITERGRAVVESGLSVRQAHEIETGCSEDNPCANCRRYVTVRDALLDEARAAGSLVAEEYLTGIRLRDGTPGGHMSDVVAQIREAYQFYELDSDKVMAAQIFTQQVGQILEASPEPQRDLAQAWQDGYRVGSLPLQEQGE